jgi:hypothetical protein
MLMSENPRLRQMICSRFSDLIKNFEKNPELENLAQGLLILELN